MFMKWILPILLFCSLATAGEPLRVVVLDTGIQTQYKNQLPLCKDGHKSFVPNETIEDYHGHGTNVAGLIQKHAGEANYCFVIVKYFSTNKKNNSLRNLINALRYINQIEPDIINLSGGGYWSVLEEYILVQSILSKGTHFIVAAGNELQNLNRNCAYYPACYDRRIWVVGSNTFKRSNFGNIVDVLIDGVDKTAYGITMTGTSQSTAIFTGRVINNLSRNRK